MKENEIETLNQKIYNCEKSQIEIENKYKDAIREVELAKQNERDTSTIQFEESLKNNELKATILQQKNEIEDMKRNNKILNDIYNEENNKLKDKFELQEDKMIDFKTVQSENEKLKLKLKEYTKLKEKISDYENLLIIIESKSKNLDNMQHEKKTLMLNLEKLQKEVITEKDKYRNLEFEKKKTEIELNDSKNMINRLENRLDNQFRKRDSIVKIKFIQKNYQDCNKDNYNTKANGNNIENEVYVLNELEDDDDKVYVDLNIEIERIKAENQVLMKENEDLKSGNYKITALNLEDARVIDIIII